MNWQINARQVLGISENASRDEIYRAFQQKVAELSYKNISARDFKKKVDQLVDAREYLSHSQSLESPFSEMNRFFDKHANHINNPNQLADECFSKNYSSYSRSIEMRDGKIINASEKSVQNNNGNVHKKERYYDGTTGQISVKKTRPDGTVNAYQHNTNIGNRSARAIK